VSVTGDVLVVAQWGPAGRRRHQGVTANRPCWALLAGALYLHPTGPRPALERLRRTFTNRASCHRLERAPTVHDPSNWTPEVEAYRDNDLVDEPPLLRSGASLDAVRPDSRDTLDDSARHALWWWLDRPLVLLRAPCGIFGEPPALYPHDLVAAARYQVRIDHDAVVEGTNHDTIVLGDRGAAAVAARC
jgi:hypothetical protein